MLAGLLVPTAIGVLCVAAESTSALSACGGALIVGGGGFGVGWLIGFIFGLPKMIGQAGGQLQANTNLEKISDWLPTAVLGASAVQADAIREAIVAIGKSMHEACTLPAPMIEGVLVVSLVAGFIAGWLAARLHLNKSMLNSDLDAAALGPVTPNLQGQPGKDQDA